MPRYAFYQPHQQDLTPSARRKLEIESILGGRREEERFGRQELEAMKEFTRLEQEEYRLKNEIDTEKQVAAAQREVAELNPEKDGDWLHSYADVMKKYPRAQSNKFLNEAFVQGSSIFKTAQKSRLADAEVKFKEGAVLGREQQEEAMKLNHEAIEAGIDTSAFVTQDPSGNLKFDYAGITKALTKAKSSFNDSVKKMTEGPDATMKPTKVTVDSKGVAREEFATPKPEATTKPLTFNEQNKMAEMESRIAAYPQRIKNMRSQLQSGKDEQGNPLDEKVKATLPGNITAMENEMAILPTQKENLVKRVPQAATPTPAAPAATPRVPSQAHIDYLTQNPHLADQFDAKFGQGSSATILRQPQNQPDAETD